MKIASIVLNLFCVISFATSVDLQKAPPSFTHQGKRLIPIDFLSQDLLLTFDLNNQETTGISKITFIVEEEGFPFFDISPEVRSIKLDGEKLATDSFPEIFPPYKGTRLRMLNTLVKPGVQYVLEITYQLSEDQVTYDRSGIRFGWFMLDVVFDEERGFLEQFAPANLEFDSFALTTKVKILGFIDKNQKLFSNGTTTRTAKNQWQVQFPPHFTSSSFYLHLTNAPVDTIIEEYEGIEKKFPITVYSLDRKVAEESMEQIKKVVHEMEETYGPFCHPQLLVYVTQEDGSMEYCGAAMTNREYLEHEISHSWFARGVMPANGNSGWIDEAIVSWRDREYPSLKLDYGAEPVNLANHSPYKRTTPEESYDEGSTLIAGLDHLFAEGGGMKKILREFYRQHKGTTVTTPLFQKFLELWSGHSVAKPFERFVYGKGLRSDVFNGLWNIKIPTQQRHHHRRYSAEQLKRLR